MIKPIWPVVAQVITPLGSFTLTSHALFFTLGAIVAMVYAMVATRKMGDWLDRAELVAYAFIIGLLGARTSYLLAYPDEWKQLSDIVALWRGGLISFGGITASALFVHYRTRGWEFAESIRSHIVIATLLGWSIGRLGNFFAAESGGVATNSFLAISGVMPIQLFESLGCVILGIGLALALTKKKLTDIQVIWYSGIGYLTLRFLVDFWRDESVVMFLRVGQWISLLGLIGIIYFYRRTRSHE